MSLALNVEGGARRGARRMAIVLAALMCATLLMSAWTGWQAADGAPGDARRWWLPLACALGCAAWCGFVLRRLSDRERSLRLRIAPDGAVQLAGAAGQPPLATAVVAAWRLGGCLYLRLRPADGRRDHRLLLCRGDVAPAQWHGLRRWQVWLQRSVTVNRIDARSA